MKKLSIDVDDEIKDYFLPENWDEVKLSDFITLFSVDKTNLNPLEISVKTIEILLKIDEEILMMMKLMLRIKQQTLF
jgi:hypothetical protein